MRVFIYSRKSVYTGKGESIENQIEMCREYMLAKLPHSDEAEMFIYEDEGFSAKNTERPQFQQMLRDMKQDRPDYVVCYRLDRISRNVSDFSSLIEELNRCNISFICIKEEFDTSKPMGQAMMYIASVFAQLERETIAERVRDNMLMLARTGRWLGGTTPTGFTSEKVQEIIIEGKIKTSCKLKDNPDELKAVDCMLEKFLELRSVSGVSRYLIRQGIKSRNGKFFSLLGIKQILQNPVYCISDEDAWDYFTERHADVCFERSGCSDQYGLLAYNKRDYRKKNAPRQAMDKWIVAMGRHRGRIPGRKWVTIQAVLKDNIPTGKKPALLHNGYSVLSGLIYCGKCHGRMFAKQRTGKGHDQACYDYICDTKLRGGLVSCDCQNLGGRQTDDLVCGYLMQYADGAPGIRRPLEKLKRVLQGQRPVSRETLIDEKIKKCSGEIDNLIRTLSHGNLGPAFIERVNARITELDSELFSLKEERLQLQKDGRVEAVRAVRAAELAAASLSFKDHIHLLSVTEKRAFIRLIAGKIIWDGRDLHVYVGSWPEE